jgi:hypothetical protein
MHCLVRRAGLLVLCLVASACGRLMDVEVAAVDASPVEAPEESPVYAADGSRIATLRFARLGLALGSARVAQQARAMGVPGELGTNEAVAPGRSRGGR